MGSADVWGVDYAGVEGEVVMVLVRERDPGRRWRSAPGVFVFCERAGD